MRAGFIIYRCMSDTGGDDADKNGKTAGSARQLFGHKGGAKPWDAPRTPPPPPPAESKDTSSAPYPRDATYTPRPSAEEKPAASSEAKAELESQLGPLDDEGELTKLHPNYKLLMRVGAIIVALVIIGGAAVLELALSQEIDFPTGIILGPAVLVALFIAIRIPLARYNARGYQISRDRLRVVRGILFRSDTVVPFGRVQHIDVDQGPIERALDIATLTLHTAGSHNASVRLPGLGHALAVEMRETIRAHIKRETL
ncbi:hypothetical protein NAP1_12498 [Erythrobacter sp. NAP1]|nr:hypothetical protein NAP1_12498 [Erythrobacter sp. NAP1]